MINLAQQGATISEAVQKIGLGHYKSRDAFKSTYSRYCKQLKKDGLITEVEPTTSIDVTKDEISIINEYRQAKSELVEECKQRGVDPADVKYAWFKSKKMSMFVRPDEKNIELLQGQLIEEMKQYSPKYPSIRRSPSVGGSLLVIDPADIHIGKLSSSFETGESYNVAIAVSRVREGLKSLLSLVQPFQIDKIVLVMGNDVLHTDTTKRTTTSGTPQDTDGMWHENFLIAKDLYVDIIETLSQLADVHCVFNPSNHDFMSGFFLAQCVEAWFSKCGNITFDCTMRNRKIYKYHDNLLGFTHGDGAKETDLPLLLATEFPVEWAESKFRKIYKHHLHHKNEKDYIGVTVQTVRTTSGADGWHHKSGYQHAPKAMECFLHGKGKGQYASFSHYF
jgi:hypothetical protein